MKSTIYKICGAVPAGNYIQFPRTASQSLSLNGQFLYLLFKPIPGKFFFVHLDVVTEENLVIRISFSNLFKQFKMTTTWLQFPYISNAPTGSIEEATCAGLPVKGTSFLSLCLQNFRGYHQNIFVSFTILSITFLRKCIFHIFLLKVIGLSRRKILTCVHLEFTCL